MLRRSKNEGAHMPAKLNYCLNQDFILDWGRVCRDLRGVGKSWFIGVGWLFCLCGSLNEFLKKQKKIRQVLGF